MHLARIEEIIIPPERIRKVVDPEKVGELAQSIREVGLLHLPICRRTKEGLLLISGFRRFSALSYLHGLEEKVQYIGSAIPAGQIPYEAFEDLSAEQAIEIELQENTVREDLSWQDRVAATKRLHDLYKLRDPRWGQKDSAEAIGIVPPAMSQRLVLADHLDDPEVAAAKTERDAVAIVRKKMEKTFRDSLAETTGEVPIDLRQGHAIDLLSTLADKSIHLFLTDPPYGVNAQNFGVGEAHTYNDNPDDMRDMLHACLVLMFQKAAEQSHLFLFCDVKHFEWLRVTCDKIGWQTWTSPFIWYKDIGHIPDANLGPRKQYECVLYANKGKRPVSKLVSDVVEIPADKDKRHPAQKPVDLYRFFLSLSVVPGDIVCDPFCGSGTIFLAAQPFRVKTIGFELDPETVKIAKQRWMEVQ